MKNFKVTSKEDGKEYWISRALAVVGIIQVIKLPEYIGDKAEYYYLVSKRGQGCPDYKGKWNLVCGYLDFDETREQAVKREIWEELGLDLDKYPSAYSIDKVSEEDRPEHDPRQNVIFRYLIDLDYNWIKERLDNGTINTDTASRGGEDGEVDEIKLIHCEEIENYEWAFNHDKILLDINERFI